MQVKLSTNGQVLKFRFPNVEERIVHLYASGW